MIMAPGVNITAGGAVYSGTSQATPFAAAAYAIKSAATPKGFSGYCTAYLRTPVGRVNYGGLATSMTVNLLDLPTCLAEYNDYFAYTNSFGASGFGAGENVFATKEPGEPNHAGNVGGHSVWATFTATGTGPYVINTIGSSFNTLLAVYTGTSVSALTQVAASNGGTGSTVTFQALAGTKYSVAVDGANGATGTYVLNNVGYTSTNLSISMTGAEATPTSIKYIVTVNNAGPGIATNTKVTVNLPAGVTLDTTQAGGCTAVGNVVTCLPGSVYPPGWISTNGSITFYGKATVPSNYSTTASVSSDLTNLNTTNNSVTAVTPFGYAHLSLSLYASEAATTSVQYVVSVNNAGPLVATGVKATVNLPVGVTFDTTKPNNCTVSGSVVTCLIGTVNASSAASAYFFAIVPALGSYTATATVTDSVVDILPPNNTASAPITVVTYVPPQDPGDVPTLPQWGVIILGCLLFGTTLVKNRINISRWYKK
jgi:uncharacterized repeat protein (TIGR01451 family)